jgi:hypothetical protein
MTKQLTVVYGPESFGGPMMKKLHYPGDKIELRGRYVHAIEGKWARIVRARSREEIQAFTPDVILVNRQDVSDKEFQELHMRVQPNKGTVLICDKEKAVNKIIKGDFPKRENPFEAYDKTPEPPKTGMAGLVIFMSMVIGAAALLVVGMLATLMGH